MGLVISLRVEHCRSCQAGIIWLPHETTGKRAPIDAGENPEGNIVIDERRGCYYVLTQQELALGGQLSFSGRQLEPRHTSHFATCPHARGWRMRRRWTS